MDAFGPALAGADHIVLTDIYAAGEEPIAGVTLDALAAAVRRVVTRTGRVAPALDDVVAAIVRAARPGDVVDHARRRIDRHVFRIARGALGGRVGVSAVAGARRSPFPPRARQAGAPRSGAGARWRGRPIRYGRSPLVARRRGLSRRRRCRRTPMCCSGPHRRARQRTAVERRSAGGAERPARRESVVDRPRSWRRRLLSSPWVRDAALRRSLPSTVDVVVSERQPIGIGRINGGDMYLVDERGVIIDRVRPAIRRSGSADHRRARRRRPTTVRSPTSVAPIWRRA